MKRHTLVYALIFSALMAPSANAQSNLGLKRLGVAVGFVDPEGLDGTFSLGVFANHGTVAPRIGLESRIDYWGSSQSFFGSEFSFRDIAIGARGKYLFQVSNPKIQPFAGTGLALHFYHSEMTVQTPSGPQSADASSTKLGLDLGGGISTPVGPRADFLAELWYGIASDVDQFSLRIGMSRKLGI